LNDQVTSLSHSKDKLTKQVSESEEYIKNLCIEAENIENINNKLNVEAKSAQSQFDALQTLILELETSNSE
jgi:FtsZ-binding cell division protein ZapB